MRHPGSLLKELDLTKEKFLDLVSQARGLKRAKSSHTEHPLLKGKNIALVFEKSSTRTRCAFEVAAHDQGAHVTYLDPTGSHMGREESIPDTAKVLGRMFDAIEFRGFAQDTVETLAEHAGVPVWNGLTDSWHPTQMLADILTMTENFDGQIEDIKFAFVGDGHNNVARSLLITGALLGMDVRIVAPKTYWPAQDIVERARQLAVDSGARITLTESLEEGVVGADFVATDVWVSMGEPKEVWDERITALAPYAVTMDVLRATGNADVKFLHCLPAFHDLGTKVGQEIFEQYGLESLEVTDEVFESEHSVVFDEAENRMHTIKAVLVATLGR